MAVILTEIGDLASVGKRAGARGTVSGSALFVMDTRATLIQEPVLSAADAKVTTNSPTPFTGPIGVVNPTKQISGIIYGPGDIPVPNVIVKLFRQADDLYVTQTLTDSSGAYSIPRDDADTTLYYCIAYSPTQVPQIHGMSDRDLAPIPLAAP